MAKRGRYEIRDRAKGQASELARFNHLNPRFAIVDRETGEIVDEAESRYDAQQMRRNWNQRTADA